MSDELIEEAKRLIAHTKTYNFGMWSADKLAHEVAPKLVEALESATRVPVQGEPNNDREAIASILSEHGAGTYLSMADAIISRWPRAAVPDAATELSEMRKMVEEAKQNPDGVEWQTFWDRLTEDQIIELLDEVSITRAERDAYLAAIADARGVLDLLSNYADESNGAAYGTLSAQFVKAHVVTALAALDGAHEPEWEYSVGFNDPECGWINDHADIHDNYEDARSDYSEPYWMVEDRVVRRRKAGPWLPVEGESKP